MDPSQKTSGKAVNSDGRPGSDKLAELERRYVRKDSPSPESAGAIRVELPGARVSFRPRRLRPLVPWIIAGLSFFGVTGSSIAGYYAAFRAGHAKQAELEATVREVQDENATLKATVASLSKRVRTLEGASDAPMIVKGH